MDSKYTHFQEDNSDTITIDGFTVGTTNDFTITRDYVVKRLIEFNKRYFNGDLPIGDILEIKVFPYKNVLGSVISSIHESYCEVKSFRISNYFARSEKTYCDTILHEMIHVYQHTILYPDDYTYYDDAHGRTFLKKMREINSFGWKVATTETTEEYSNRGEKNSKIVKREEQANDLDNYYLFVYVPQETEIIDSPKYNGKVSFNVISRDEVKELLPVLQSYNCPKNYFRPSKRIIYIFEMKDSEFTKILQQYGYLLPRKRVIYKNYKKSSDRLDYIVDRTFAYKYSAMLDMEEKGLIKNIEGKKLPKVGDKLTEARVSRLDRLERIKKAVAKDPYVKVLGVQDDGGVEIEVS